MSRPPTRTKTFFHRSRIRAHLHTATNKVASFRKERRIYPAGHSITQVGYRMNAVFRRSVRLRPKDTDEMGLPSVTKIHAMTLNSKTA